MIINFECQKCSLIFDCDVGMVTTPDDSDRPHFEKPLICPSCGNISMDEVWLTELGQTQLTEATFPSDDECPYDDDTDDLSISGICQGCDNYHTINDIGLCDLCAAKLDRDFIRQRQWEYSTAAFCVDQAAREQLRNSLIKQYGEKNELITSSEPCSTKSKKTKNRKKKRKGTR